MEIGQWIAEAKVQRLAAEAQVRQATNGTATLTRQQVQAVIEGCAEVARDLRDADPADIARPIASLACSSPTTQGGTS